MLQAAKLSQVMKPDGPNIKTLSAQVLRLVLTATDASANRTAHYLNDFETKIQKKIKIEIPVNTEILKADPS